LKSFPNIIPINHDYNNNYYNDNIPHSFTSQDIKYRFGKNPQDTKDWFNTNNTKESDIIRHRVDYFCRHYNNSLVAQNRFIRHWVFQNRMLIRVGYNSGSTSGDSRNSNNNHHHHNHHHHNNNNNKNNKDSFISPFVPLKLVVYQRDLNRHFHHLKGSLQQIFELLSTLSTATTTTSTSINPVHDSKEANVVVSDVTNLAISLNRTDTDAQSTTSAHSRWTITIIRHNENTQPCDLYHTLRDADLLLTTHGFQAMCKYCRVRIYIYIYIYIYTYIYI
jgi:hypothetical protein